MEEQSRPPIRLERDRRRPPMHRGRRGEVANAPAPIGEAVPQRVVIDGERRRGSGRRETESKHQGENRAGSYSHLAMSLAEGGRNAPPSDSPGAHDLTFRLNSRNFKGVILRRRRPMRTSSLFRTVLSWPAVVLAFSLPALSPAGAQFPGPSLVSVSGHQLIVRKRNPDGTLAAAAPYAIRGVVWSPASKDTSTTPSDPNNAAVRRPEFARWAATDVPLMAGMNANTARVFLDLGFGAADGPAGLQILDQMYARGIMVILTVDDSINNTARVTSAVNFYKNHPAVLMWMLGNEWNINRYYGAASSVLNAAQRTESAAALIKSLDSNHPVSTSYGEIDINADGLRLADTQHYVRDVAPSVDIWGLNIYRSSSFGTLFAQWASISTKPMFLGEFGTDALSTSCARTNPTEATLDERTQKLWDLGLWNEVAANLSAVDPTKVALGGTVFDLSDEWWKVTPSGSQQKEGFLFINGHPDDFANEEYFGLADIDRNPREAYYAFRQAFAPGAQALAFPPSRVDSFSMPAAITTNLPAFL